MKFKRFFYSPDPDQAGQAVAGEEVETKEDKTYTQAEVDEMLKGYKTQEEVDNIVKQRLARERQKAEEERQREEEEKKEAERLSKLTESERRKEEARKAEEEIAELKAKIARNELEKDTIDRLNEEGLPIQFKSFLMQENAEKTNEAIKNFKEAFNQEIQKQVEERLKGKTPGGQTGSADFDPWENLKAKYKRS